MVYQNIKRIAMERELSIRSIELKAGISTGSIGKWRHCSPTIDSLMKVANVLEVPVEELLEGVI